MVEIPIATTESTPTAPYRLGAILCVLILSVWAWAEFNAMGLGELFRSLLARQPSPRFELATWLVWIFGSITILLALSLALGSAWSRMLAWAWLVAFAGFILVVGGVANGLIPALQIVLALGLTIWISLEAPLRSNQRL